MKLFYRHFKKNITFILGVIIILTIIVIGEPPRDFPQGRFDIHVENGDSISSAAEDLYAQNVISSKTLFKIFAILISKNNGIKAGDYRFNYPQNTLSIAKRMVNGEEGQTKVRVTVPEGTNSYDIAYILLKGIPDFNAPKFIALSKKYEGYLYPDTYYFFENVKVEQVITTMVENFQKQVETIEEDLDSFGRPFKEVLTMASIVEKESTHDEETRRTIAGILWKRIDDGMLLQVDAPFYYLTKKAGNFTLDDLKIESPYNTYLNKGLPPGPISNPSIDTILDTVRPIKTSYWFYLTGNDGKMRYAPTYEEHLANKNRYLR
jgi:UPF0755 protein